MMPAVRFAVLYTADGDDGHAPEVRLGCREYTREAILAVFDQVGVEPDHPLRAWVAAERWPGDLWCDAGRAVTLMNAVICVAPSSAVVPPLRPMVKTADGWQTVPPLRPKPKLTPVPLGPRVDGLTARPVAVPNEVFDQNGRSLTVAAVTVALAEDRDLAVDLPLSVQVGDRISLPGGLTGLVIRPATLNLLAVVRPLPAESK